MACAACSSMQTVAKARPLSIEQSRPTMCRDIAKVPNPDSHARPRRTCRHAAEPVSVEPL